MKGNFKGRINLAIARGIIDKLLDPVHKAGVDLVAYATNSADFVLYAAIQ